MRDRPILFSGPMVRAILAGQKTVTRRVVKLPRWAVPGTIERFDVDLDGASAERRSDGEYAPIPCPYGVPGDRLWVRETFAEHEVDDVQGTRAFYRADHADGECQVRPGWALKWTPGIHMPRVVSRITLEVVSVRVERLHAITEEDAIREGVDAVSVADVPRNGTLTRRDDFAQLWERINGERAPWTSNPWVWRVEFRRVEGRR